MERVEELVQAVPAREVVDQGSQWNARPGEDDGSTEDLGVAVKDGIAGVYRDAAVCEQETASGHSRRRTL